MKEHYCHLPLQVVYYEIQSSKLPKSFDGCRIAFLTDLHSNLHGEKNRRLLKKIKQASPDCVMCAGDMVVGSRKPQECRIGTALELFSSLAEKWEIFYSLGNHEQKLATYPETRNSTYAAYLSGLKKMGVHVLDNEKAYLKRGRSQIAITGLTADYKYYSKVWKGVSMEASYVREAAGEPEKGGYQILLAHNPEHFGAYAHWGADLALSGHVHGGIAILPKLGGVIAPSYQLFPKYDFGKFRKGGCDLVVSRGLGTHTIHLRILNRPEISLITLKSLQN